MQGLSLKPILLGTLKKYARSSLYYHYYEFPIDHHVYPHLGIRTERYKLIYFYSINEWEFYDLKRDPDEQQNRINDASLKNVIAELKVTLNQQRKFYKDTEPAGLLR